MSSLRSFVKLWGHPRASCLAWRLSTRHRPATQNNVQAAIRLLCASNRHHSSGDAAASADDDKQDEADAILTDWIPPDRPLVGDKGSSHLYKEKEMDDDEDLRKLEIELEKLERDDARGETSSTTPSTNDIVESERQEQMQEESIDWLQTRRSKQQQALLEGVDMMTPDLGASKKFLDSDLDVIPHTLLTRAEITSCLTAMGGKDVVVLPNTPERRMGAASGMFLVTASTPAQILLLADTLVRQLKRRDLAELGVVGARYGAEGSDDKFDTWRVVDCSNYIVHVMDANTRKHLNLEALWSGEDDALRVDINDEDAMDAYVAANPVPEGYNPNTQDWTTSISQMERNRWIVPHRPVVQRPNGKWRKRRRGRRR